MKIEKDNEYIEFSLKYGEIYYYHYDSIADIDYDFGLNKEETRKLYEAMKEYYERTKS